MISYKDELNRIKRYYEEEQKKCRRELAEKIKGELKHYTSKGYSQFVIVRNENGIYSRSGINSKPEVKKDLARKKYLEIYDERLSNNIDLLAYAINNFDDTNAKAILSSIEEPYSLLPDNYFFGEGIELVDSNIDLGGFIKSNDMDFALRMKEHERWANEEYERSTRPFGNYAQLTSRGEKVRSQRELMIAEKFHDFKVPFRYEPILRINGVVLTPDFEIQDFEYKSIYLEYCGMMDNPEYVRMFLQKRSAYESAGICEWKNMIYMFSDGSQMDTKLLESIIKNQIIPRL